MSESESGGRKSSRPSRNSRAPRGGRNGRNGGRGGRGAGKGRGRGGQGRKKEDHNEHKNDSNNSRNNNDKNTVEKGIANNDNDNIFESSQDTTKRDQATTRTTRTKNSSSVSVGSSTSSSKNFGEERGGGRGRGRSRGRGRGGRGRGRGRKGGRGGRHHNSSNNSKNKKPQNSTESDINEEATERDDDELESNAAIDEEQYNDDDEETAAAAAAAADDDNDDDDNTYIRNTEENKTASQPTAVPSNNNNFMETVNESFVNAKPANTIATIETSAAKATPVLSLPSSAAISNAAACGVPMILSRNSHPAALSCSPLLSTTKSNKLDNNTSGTSGQDPDSDSKQLSGSRATAALKSNGQEMKGEVSSTDNNTSNKDKSSRKSKPEKNTRKKKDKKEPEKLPSPETTTADSPEEVSTTDALTALPQQEVSITAATKVQIRRDESTASLNKLDNGESKPTGSKSKKGKSKKKKGLLKDDAANQKAAKNFNKSVRACVERSDPDAMREILHDKRNHNFALEKNVLETVMKAYVMAAMFEDALYCLRNCTLPGTLSTIQTERILTCLPQNLRNSSAYTAADMINALCIATEFDNPTSRTYFLRIVRGISLEFLEEVTSARDRICSAPCERLVRAAVCVVDARLKRGKKPTELLVQPGEQLGVFVPDTMENRGIQAGDAVSLLPYAGPYPMSAESLDRNMIEATVTNTNPMVLRLQDKTNANLYEMLTEQVDGNVYRIDKLANRMGFNRQLAAAVAIASPMGESKTRDIRRPSPKLIKAITAMDENIDRVMKQSGNFPRGELTSTAALCSEAVPWSYEDEDDDGYDQDSTRMASALALEKYGALEGLNASQSLAVEGAVTNRLTLVQGPPGTGKTAVAIRILQHWARLASSSESVKGENPYPILATSDSNIAVDNLVEGCASVGLRVVRLGRPEAIRPELLRFCIDRPPTSYNGNSQQYGGNNSAMAFKERMKHLKRAQVICCTCIGSGGDILDAMTFDRVLVDEATQATEPAVLVPLMRGCRQLVLVGDHCQLPPTVLSTRAEEEGHGVPLFSRMVACGVPPFMLDTQYRMHPCIAMFPSDLFYGGKLLNGVSAPERRPLAGFPWPREEFPVAFISVKGVEMDDGVSKLNEKEAAAACEAVEMLLSGGQCTVSDIAVVTPYAAQARLIRRMTRRLLQNSGPPYIEVSSVDGFQGREKEAVVFSAVRSNDYGAIGFTSDWRRVNVSFTRARRALIVIGNDQTLRRGDPDTWMPWLAWADAHGLNMDKPGVPRGRYDPEQLRRVRGGTTAAEMLKDVLERQQAQLKTAQKQLQNAEKNAAGHIIGSGDYDDDGGIGTSSKNSVGGNSDTGSGNKLTLAQDLARLTNTDGHWDDSDDDGEDDMRRSVSQPTLTSVSSSNDRLDGDNDSEDTGAPVDAWDL